MNTTQIVTTRFASIVLAATLGYSGLVSANCADNAIDVCNAKHPNPNKSDHAYELYELCINAQLSQQCHNAADTGTSAVADFTSVKRPVLPARAIRR